MRLLADINVWVPLGMSNHARHEEVLEWFDALGQNDVVYFCRTTQQGFLRLVTDAKVFQQAAMTNKSAWLLYEGLLRDARIGWIDEPDYLDRVWIEYAGRRTPSPKLWMDAYLAAFARLHGLRFVTFDKGFRNFNQLDWIDLNLK